MRFVDEVTVDVSAGDGGNGCVSFRRMRYNPHGGPDGGDGGRGGDVLIEATTRLQSLQHFRHRRRFAAARGRGGSSNYSKGRDGGDCVISVPVGTLIYDAEGAELLADLDRDASRFVAARGGRGGRGNAAFATPSRQAPDFAKPGEPGECRRLRLELRLMADVGLIGLPNAGKSTLIRGLSASKAKVADYPFTTLAPNLGVVDDGERPFVVADVPGLLPGAHCGTGLGLQFLRHVSRTAVLAHIAAAVDDTDPVLAVEQVTAELRAYDPELALRPRVFVLTKSDLVPAGDDTVQRCAAWAGAHGLPFVAVSGLTGQGLDGLARLLGQAVASHRPLPAAEPDADSDGLFDDPQS